MSKPRRILPKKLSITLVLLAFPLFVVCLGIFFQHAQDILHKEAVERSSSVLNTTMQRVVNFMTAVETAGNANVWTLEENFNPESLEALSNRIVRMNASVLSCAVSAVPNTFPEFGRYFSVFTINEGDTIMTMLEPDYEYTERAWYKAALETGKACWVDPFSDFNSGAINFTDAVASYSIPLRPDGKQIAGVVSTEFSFNHLAEIIRTSESPFPSAYYMLLGADGRYLIHPEVSYLFKKTIFTAVDSIQSPDVIALGREMVAGNRGTKHVVKDDVKYHVCYAPVPGTQWSLALVCHDDEVLSDYYHLTYLVIIIVVVGLLLILWMSAIVVRRNIKPLNQLMEATQKIAGGEYDVVIPRSDRKDVVSQLQNAFAMMQQAIMERMENIKQATEALAKENEELEQATKQAAASTEEKRHFVRHVLRQIQTPLNVIEGLTQVMLTNMESKSDMGNITSTMKLQATRLIRRVIMLYDSSDTQANNETLYQRNKKVPCNEVAKECVDYMRSYNPDMEVRVETELPDDTCIFTNQLYLMRSINELLLNSYKYSDGKHITLRLSQSDSTVDFIVEDVGPGIPKDWQDLFNQPFKKGDEMSRGLGLGLPLVKRHISNLGGEIIFDTEYQQGCRIILMMPK